MCVFDHCLDLCAFSRVLCACAVNRFKKSLHRIDEDETPTAYFSNEPHLLLFQQSFVVAVLVYTQHAAAIDQTCSSQIVMQTNKGNTLRL